MISGLLCIYEKFRLASSSCPNPSLPNVSVLVFNVPFFSGYLRHSYFMSVSFPEYSVVHISSFPGYCAFAKCSVLFPFRFPVHHCRMSEAFCFVCSLTSGNFRPAYLIISVSIPDYSVVIFSEVSVLHISSFPLRFRIIPWSYFRKFPSFIFHHFRFISGLFRRHISGNFALHISSFPLHFRIIASSYFRKFPSFIFHHFRFISGLLRRLISANFRHSYFIISGSFPDYSVVLFPEVSVLQISSFPFHFRIIPFWPSASFLIWACFV